MLDVMDIPNGGEGCLYWVWCSEDARPPWFDYSTRFRCERALEHELVCLACPDRIERLLDVQ